MQRYEIKSFRRLVDGLIFTKVEQGTNSGSFVNRTEVKGLMDFMCNPEFVINSIQNNEGTNTGLYTSQDRLVHNTTTQMRVQGFKIVNSEVIIITNYPTPGDSVKLINAQKYVEPVLTPATRPTTTRRRTNTTNQTTTPLGVIEQTILTTNPRAIRLERTLKATANRLGLEEFLKRFFMTYNAERATIFADDSTQQTPMGRRRSLGDIYGICKYYFPDCTLQEVLELLYITLPEEINSGFRSSYCNTINKRVWYYDATRENIVADKTRNDEFGKPHRFYIEQLGGE